MHFLSENKRNILVLKLCPCWMFCFAHLPLTLPYSNREKDVFVKQFGMVCEKKNRSLVFSVNRKIPTLRSTVLVGNSTSLVSHWNGGPSGWDFPVPTEHQWWILFVLSLYRIPELFQVFRIAINTIKWNAMKILITCAKTLRNNFTIFWQKTINHLKFWKQKCEFHISLNGVIWEWLNNS